jgi:hypothetical protein
MPICAYCRTSGSLTKEHIWPRTLIQKFEALRAYSPRTNRFHGGEPVVRDVCASCNSGRLSVLDNYLSQVFDSSFAKVLEPGQPASFPYDYPLLLRALLKISFNSSRSMPDEDTQRIHARFAQFILDGGYCPRVELRLQIVTRAKSINLETGEEGALDPVQLRCATIAYDGPLSRRFLVRVIGFNSFWFFLIFSRRPEQQHKWAEVLNALGQWKIRTGVPVSPSGKMMHIPVNQTTYMHPSLLGSMLGAVP